MPNPFEKLPQPVDSTGDAGGGIESQEKPGEYLYHMIPKGQLGEQLMPLNTLKDIHPDTYAKAAAKYQGREHLMEQQIPTLDAKWNDVLHLTAVPPSEVKKALIMAGAKPPEMEWYRIPKSLISADATVVYSGESPSGQITDEEVKPYKEEDLPGYAQFPDKTRQYYKEEIEAGRRPLLFQGVPHILYKGTINTANLEKIKT
jgi:hypothetical protein